MLEVTDLETRARQITLRGLSVQSEDELRTDDQRRQFHDTYQTVLGELMTAMDPETY